MKKIESPLLEVSNLCVKDKSKSIEKFSINILRGDSIAVLCSDSANTELLTQILSGKGKTDKGKIYFKGDDVTGFKNAFGVIGKKSNIQKSKSIIDSASAPIVKRGLARNMAQLLVKKELCVFDLEEYAEKIIGRLPQNVSMRAELFTAYMCSHELMVIDEPFGTLISEQRKIELEWLCNIKDNTGISLLILTKSIDVAVLLCETVMVVNDKMESVGIISIDRKKLDKTVNKIEELTEML